MRQQLWRPILVAATLLGAAMITAVSYGRGGAESQNRAAPLNAQKVAKPFTYKSDWGTFKLSPEIQARVKDKLAKGKQLDIPVFSWTTGNVFFNPIRKGVGDAAKKFDVHSQLIGPADPNQAEMIQDIQSYLSRKPDGIAVIPQNQAELEGVVSRLVKSGLPVVVYNTEMAKGSKRLVYVGQDNRRAGSEVGKLLVRKLKKRGITKGTVAMFAVDASAAYSNDLRFPGFRKVISRALPNIQFAKPVSLGNDVSAGVGAIDAGVRGKPDVVAIYVADEQVVSAGTWVKRNAPGKYVVVGHNLLPNELELVAGGYINGLVGQNPYNQGYRSVQWLYRFLTSGKAICGVTCDTGYPVVDSASQARKMLKTNCGGQGCG